MALWKKIFLTSGMLIIALPSFALTCSDGFHGWSFAGVSIKSGQVSCTYRSCYYGCSYDSYQLEGCYKPSSGPWEDGSCGSNNSVCQFTTTNCDNKLKT